MGSLTATTTTNMKGPMKACRQVIGFNPCPPFHHYRTAASDIHNNEGVGGLLSISTINSTTTAASRSGNRPYDPVSPCSRRSGLQALLAADKSPPTSPPPPQPIISSSSSSSSSSSAGTLPISSNTVGASCSKPAMASASSSSRSVLTSCSKSAIVISPPPSVRTSLYSCNTAGLNCSKPAMASSSSSSSSLSVGTLQNSHKTTVASCSKPAMAISSSSASAASSHSSSSPHSAGTLPASCRTSGVSCKSPAAIASSSSHGCHSQRTSFFFISTPDAFLTDSIDVYLGACFLCKRHLPSTEDIFIYRGERAFCSEDCRSKHRFTNRKEEEEEEKTSEEFTKLIIQRIVGYQNRSKRLTERAAAA